MGRFRYSGIAVTGGTGRLNSSLGGNVLLKNGVVRNYVTPVNPQTADQTAVRNVFNQYTSGWADALSESQRLQWETAAASGEWTFKDTFTGSNKNATSGKQLYISLNMNIWLGSGKSTANEISTPPPKEVTGNSAIGAVTITAGTQAYSIVYAGALGGNEAHAVFSSPPLSDGTMKIRKSAMRYIGDDSGASPIDILTAYQDKYGNLTGNAGKVIFTQLWAINVVTGQKRLAGSARTVIGT